MVKLVRLPSILAKPGSGAPGGGSSMIFSMRPCTSSLAWVPPFSGWKVTIPKFKSLTSGRPIQGGDQLELDGGRRGGQVFFVDLDLGRAGAHAERFEQVGQAERAEQLGGVFDVVEEVARVEDVAGSVAQVAGQRAELAGQAGDGQVGGGKAAGFIGAELG